uniref:Uncharacterized protein n=1 Tax=Romanomermis culicivorax TaxID=13658 RepID=A0A915HX54_ROMCU
MLGEQAARRASPNVLGEHARSCARRWLASVLGEHAPSKIARRAESSMSKGSFGSPSDDNQLLTQQFWCWTNSIHGIAPAILNEYNALAVKHQTTKTTTMKGKMINDGDADASATKITGKGGNDTKSLEKKAKMPQKLWEKAMMIQKLFKKV